MNSPVKCRLRQVIGEWIDEILARGRRVTGRTLQVVAALWFFVVIGFVCVVLLVVGDRSFRTVVNQGGRSERHVFGEASTR
jgi:hypothetical protein